MSPTFLQHGLNHAKAFYNAIRQVVLSDKNESRKAFIQSVVTEIKVHKKQVNITGKRLQLAAAVSEWKLGTLNPSVPSVVSNWRAWQESNLLPAP